MTMQKQLRKGARSALMLTGTGLTLGVGASVLQPLATKTGMPSISGGVSAFSGFMPAMGSIAGAGMAIGMLGELVPKQRKRRQ